MTNFLFNQMKKLNKGIKTSLVSSALCDRWEVYVSVCRGVGWICQGSRKGAICFCDSTGNKYRWNTEIYDSEDRGRWVNVELLKSRISNQKGIWRKEYYKKFSICCEWSVKKRKKIVIIFDEIEYISFKSPMDTHWHRLLNIQSTYIVMDWLPKMSMAYHL